jgi:hypothetical protein
VENPTLDEERLPKLAQRAPTPRARKLRALRSPVTEPLEPDCSGRLPVAGTGRPGPSRCCLGSIQG